MGPTSLRQKAQWFTVRLTAYHSTSSAELTMDLKLSTYSRPNKKCSHPKSLLKWAYIVLIQRNRVSYLEAACTNFFFFNIFKTTAQVKRFANYFWNLFVKEAVLYLVSTISVFSPCSSVCIVDFEQWNVSYDVVTVVSRSRIAPLSFTNHNSVLWSRMF